MMSPGSLPSNWLVWSSPSSSMRQDWSVVQLSVAEKKEGVITKIMVACYCNDTLYNVLLSGFVTWGHEPFQNKRANVGVHSDCNSSTMQIHNVLLACKICAALIGVKLVSSKIT